MGRKISKSLLALALCLFAPSAQAGDTFGDEHNFHGFTGTRLVVTVEGGTYTSEQRKAVVAALQSQLCTALTQHGVILDINRDPTVPWLEPVRPFLGEPMQLDRPTPPGTRPPGAYLSRYAPDLNVVHLHLSVTPFSDGVSSVSAQVWQERPVFPQRPQRNPYPLTGTIWQGQLWQGQGSWQPRTEELSPLAFTAMGEWLSVLEAAAWAPRLPFHVPD